MIEFAEALLRLRRRPQCDLTASGLGRHKVLATVVAMLDATHPDRQRRLRALQQELRMTTLQNRHAEVLGGGRLRLRFRGKGETEHDLQIDDRRFARIVRRCRQLPGQALFQYVDDSSVRHAVGSGQVNGYLAAAMGAPFSAKDF